MRKRKTHEQYLKEITDKNCNVQVLEEYIGARTKILHKCNACGYEWRIVPNNILNGQKCPSCSNHESYNTRKLTQDDYVIRARKANPNIEVVGDYVNNSTKILHKCCICGHEWMVRPANIIKGRGCPECRRYNLTKSHSQYVDELSKINPDIIVVENYINNASKILHMCKKCGYEWLAKPTHILCGSCCPKCNESRGERDIESCLTKHNINYIRQYKFNDCKNKNPLPFDFYLPEYNTCIEYDGRQHYEPVDIFGGEEGFAYRILNDEIKTNYCRNNNISLLRIRYDEDVESCLNLYLEKLIV